MVFNFKPPYKSPSETKFISLPYGSEESLEMQTTNTRRVLKPCLILVITFVFAGSVIYLVAGTFEPTKRDFFNSKYTSEPTPATPKTTPTCQNVSNSQRFDCFPRGTSDEKSCTARGCCWVPVPGNGKIPWCYYATGYRSYKVVSRTTYKRGQQLVLNISSNSTYPNNVQVLIVKISYETKDRLHVKVGITKLFRSYE